MKNFKTILTILFLVFVCQKAFSQMKVSANYAIIQDHLSGEILFEKTIIPSVTSLPNSYPNINYNIPNYRYCSEH